MKRYLMGRLHAPAMLIALGLFVAAPLFGQDVSNPVKQPVPAKKTIAAKAWTISKTPDGQPDLQGIWVNFDRTPFERPVQVPGAAAARRSPVISFTDQTPRVDQRDSMVVDPPDGRLPPLTDWAAEQREYRPAHVPDSYEFNSSWERCITRGVPGGIFPVVYNNAYQILQAPGYFVIRYEMIHESRIIPIDGRAHIPDSVRQWNGDPRGHWEGNTLVVETTNFNGHGMYAEYGPLIYVPESDATRLVERFTRVGPDIINYEVTIQDPKSFTAPWKVAMPLTRDDSYQMFEYACHEDNKNYMEISLGAGRLRDKAAEESEKKQ